MELTQIQNNITFNDILNIFLEKLDQMDTRTKITVIAKISESILMKPEKTQEEKFWESYGGWDTDESSERLIQEIYSSRIQREKDLEF